MDVILSILVSAFKKEKEISKMTFDNVLTILKMQVQHVIKVNTYLYVYCVLYVFNTLSTSQFGLVSAQKPHMATVYPCLYHLEAFR